MHSNSSSYPTYPIFRRKEKKKNNRKEKEKKRKINIDLAILPSYNNSSLVHRFKSLISFLSFFYTPIYYLLLFLDFSHFWMIFYYSKIHDHNNDRGSRHSI